MDPSDAVPEMIAMVIAEDAIRRLQGKALLSALESGHLEYDVAEIRQIELALERLAAELDERARALSQNRP
jgi:hypothetical protein